ncbi:hypothetical protein BDV12DRAFT_207279 [Aspergillus spectabilis]
MSIININRNTLDPEGQRPVLRALNLESDNAANSDFILIYSVEPLSSEQEKELDRLGVEIQEYASKNTYLCGLFIIDSSLKTRAAARELPSFPTIPKDHFPQTVDIILYRGIDPKSSDVLSEIAAATHADPKTLTTGSTKIRLKVQSQYLESLAAKDKVRLIQPVHAARLFNDRATQNLGTHFLAPNNTQYEGADEVVAIADTGFDEGSLTHPHPAFTNRVRQLYALGDRHGRSDDPDGHSTHVCRSVLGDGFSAAMGGAVRGAAPRAYLVVQSLLDQDNRLGGIPADLGQLFSPPYHRRWQLPYISSSMEIDTFVWENKEMVILFAAGNDGIDADRNTAKNCITVGASENNRPNIPITYGQQWPSGPISNDRMADNPGGLAAFSSRGPTREDRIKPDIIAPGTAFLSARSRKLRDPGDDFGTSSDPDWWFIAGTSMATPLVAGCAAALRETLTRNRTQNPTTALIKALLIIGAIELPGQYVPSEAGPSPNSNSSYGRVNLPNSAILPTQTDGGFREGGLLAQGREEETVVYTSGSRNPQASSVSSHVLKVTLAWTDPPGPCLQNDLDLIIKGPEGTEKHGNMGDRPDFDRSNNVEQAVWTNLPPGEVKIIVRAYHIFKRAFAQPYLCWSINRHLR